MLAQLLKRLQEIAGFTRNEQKIFLFLSLVFVTGACIKVYKVYFVHSPIQQFDYSASDAEFRRRTDHSLSPDGRDSSTIRNDNATLEKKINLNTATKNELTGLPGIGENTAEQILLYREERGKFTAVEELKKIRGIGSKKFEKILPHVEIH